MTRILLCISLMAAAGLLPAQQRYTTREQKARWLQDYCKRHYPDGTRILNYEARSLDYVQYVDGSTQADLLESLSTVIHETYHAYENEFCAGEWECVGYYFGDGIGFSVPMTEVFKTPLMDRFIPDSLKQEDFNSRYDPYIVGDLEISSHSQGIYGILEEMNAYYLGLEVNLSTWDYHMARRKGKVDEEMGQVFFAQCGSDLLALYQFRYFVAWYLEHAQQRYPAVYKGIMGNGRLRLAYTLLDDRYSAAEQRYRSRLEEYMRLAEAEGMQVKVEDGFIIFSTDDGWHGYGIFDEEMNQLDRGLLPRWRKLLQDFRLKGVTEANYHQFL